MNKRAVILAAGRGSRMGATTEFSHKCLTKLKGKTLLEWQQLAINHVDIDELLVVTGYNSQMITGNFNTVLNERWSETNMVASLFCAPAFAGDTIVSYSDIVYNPQHVIQLASNPNDIVITADKEWASLWAERFENPELDAETFASVGDDLKEIGGKTDDIAKIIAQFMGLIKFTAEGWQTAWDFYNRQDRKIQDKLDMTKLLSNLLKEGVNIKVEFVTGAWCEVDNNKDVVTYEKAIQQNENWHHDWR